MEDLEKVCIHKSGCDKGAFCDGRGQYDEGNGNGIVPCERVAYDEIELWQSSYMSIRLGGR